MEGLVHNALPMQDIVEKGSVFMEYCKVRPDEVDNLTFVVYSTVDTNQAYSFTASHSDEYVEFV